MVEMIQEDGGVIKLNTPVTSIRLTDPNLEISTMMVWTPGQKHTYSHVISTLPMPDLRTIDLYQNSECRSYEVMLKAGSWGYGKSGVWEVGGMGSRGLWDRREHTT